MSQGLGEALQEVHGRSSVQATKEDRDRAAGRHEEEWRGFQDEPHGDCVGASRFAWNLQI
ncbi:unnamed protein product [Symbiodinium sp. CCMP2592]|nr:unnamed protein product [Symbiodinium sp. CCMP2592]